MIKISLKETPVIDIGNATSDILNIIYSNNLISEVPVKGSSYIMPNGDFIDLVSHGFRTHAAFDNYIKDITGIPYEKTLLPIKYCNAIRVNDGSNFIGEVVLELPDNPITSAQSASIVDWLEEVSFKSDLVSATITGTNKWAEYDLSSGKFHQIVSKIRGYYNTGILRENKYIDPDGKYSDYGTGHVTSDNIFDDRCHVPFYDQLFTNPDYMAEHENLKGHIIKMSPREYYQICAYKIFDTTVESLKNNRARDTRVNEEIREIITKYKRQVFLPYINYAEKTQEGLHRMLVAAELFGWDHKFPVLIIEWADEEHAQQRAKQKQDEETRKYIRRAVDKALKYTYVELTDFKKELKYWIDNEFEYGDEPVTTWDVTHDDEGTTTVTVNDVSYSFATRAIELEIVPDSVDFDIEDIEDFEFSDEELEDISNLSIDDFLKKYG